MATTIDIENAKQIREPMEIYIHFFAGSSSKISTYGVTTYKNYDSTLGNSSWGMRNITDLANGGFPLDGSCEWYDSTVISSANNGKLGVRGITGSNVDVNISASAQLTTITIATNYVGTITHNGINYPSTGLNVIPINSNSAALTFVPENSNARVYIDYIIPGAEFTISNDNLVSCNLALRGNLDLENHTWEESEIEVSMYYPYDISSAFAYIQNDFPITYQAGYDSDLSPIRKFYLSAPIEQTDNVITLHGVDASHLLEKNKISGWIESKQGAAFYNLAKLFQTSIQNAGIILENKGTLPSSTSSGSLRYAIIPEMTVRDFISGAMNLTLNHKINGSMYGMQFVDAGIPTFEFGDGTQFGNTWTLNKSDCAEWTESFEQNISRIQNTDSERKFNETFSVSNNLTKIQTEITGEVNQIIETDFDGYYYKPTVGHVPIPPGSSYTSYDGTPISSTPERFVFKITKKGNFGSLYVNARSTAITGGVNSYSNSNALPGITVETEPFIYGSITDPNGEPVFNYPSLFNRSLRTGSFKFKGDPRFQPLDYLNITNDTSDGRGNITARISSIELTHEEGGTTAIINWREWS